jgi:NTP pyrophosphatase (non-canonical NTP hydrolase)
LRQADAGDLTDWVLFLARAVKQAIERTIELKKQKKRK